MKNPSLSFTHLRKVGTSALLWICLGALAHDPATLDALPSKHGGRVRMAGPFHIELVLSTEPSAAGAPIWVYLQNHAFEDVASAKVSAIVRFKEGYTVTSAVLSPKDFNLLFGKGLYRHHSSLRVEVSLTSEAQTYTATFQPFTK